MLHLEKDLNMFEHVLFCSPWCLSISVISIKLQETIIVTQSGMKWHSFEPLFLQSWVNTLGTLTLAMGWWSWLNSGLRLHHTERHRKGKAAHDAPYPLHHSSELRYRVFCRLKAGGEELSANSALFNIRYSVCVGGGIPGI